MRKTLALLALITGCGAPDTLHYALRDPRNVTVCVDGQPVLDDSDESPHYDSVIRTGDDTLASSGFTIQRTSLGLFARMDTSLPMLHGNLLELVGNDGWIAALPTDVQRRTIADQFQLFVSPHLDYVSSRHYGSYLPRLDDPGPSGHVITLSTPRDNVVAVEERGDHNRVTYGAVALVPGIIYSIIGGATLGLSHSPTTRGVGAAFTAVGGGLDVYGLYNIIRGSYKRQLPLPSLAP